MRMILSLGIMFSSGLSFSHSDDWAHPFAQQVPEIASVIEYYSNFYHPGVRGQFRCFNGEMPEASSVHPDRETAYRAALRVSLPARCIRNAVALESDSLYQQMFSPLDLIASQEAPEEQAFQDWEGQWRAQWMRWGEAKCGSSDLALVGDGVSRRARRLIRCLRIQ